MTTILTTSLNRVSETKLRRVKGFSYLKMSITSIVSAWLKNKPVTSSKIKTRYIKDMGLPVLNLLNSLRIRINRTSLSIQRKEGEVLSLSLG